ncbi:Hypothetical predicted protein, partial [Pelobates cultripes]
PEFSLVKAMMMTMRRGLPENLSKKEKMALKQLKNDPNLVIKQADKGGGIVILNREDYMQESMRILGDNTTYRILNGNPIENFKKQFSELLNKGFENKVINKDELDYLFVKSPRMAVFYYLPKIHKRLENPPGRPIISGIGSLTSNISQYVDFFLQQFVTKTPSYVYKHHGHQ